METFLAVPTLHATASHVARIQAKLGTLLKARRDAWDQLLTAAARLYAAGDLTNVDLLALLGELQESFGSGFTNVWNDNMPMPAGAVKWLVDREQRNAPNGPAGSWVGAMLVNGPHPDRGVAVVYVLFDATNVPVYVGSTENFPARMAAHRRDKPEAVRWTAYPCRDRADAYEVEDRLLREHKPRLNKRAGR